MLVPQNSRLITIRQRFITNIFSRMYQVCIVRRRISVPRIVDLEETTGSPLSRGSRSTATSGAFSWQTIEPACLNPC